LLLLLLLFGAKQGCPTAAAGCHCPPSEWYTAARVPHCC
jgi:hypothetical protein